jgi:hypothetical protein
MKKLISQQLTPRKIPEERTLQCETILTVRKPIAVLLIYEAGNADSCQLINI